MRAATSAALGELMDQSHESLRDDYEVSSEALDAMVEAARAHPACHGARMTGAGFGGCAVALIDAAGADDFVRTVAADYEKTDRKHAGHLRLPGHQRGRGRQIVLERHRGIVPFIDGRIGNAMAARGSGRFGVAVTGTVGFRRRLSGRHCF